MSFPAGKNSFKHTGGWVTPKGCARGRVFCWGGGDIVHFKGVGEKMLVGKSMGVAGSSTVATTEEDY
jgi:hypothetical protein